MDDEVSSARRVLQRLSPKAFLDLLTQEERDALYEELRKDHYKKLEEDYLKEHQKYQDKSKEVLDFFQRFGDVFGDGFFDIGKYRR